MRFALSGIRWAPILTCALVADMNFWYFASMGTNEGDYLGIGFFAVFAVGALWRWKLRRDSLYLVIASGAVVSLGVMALRETGRSDPGYIIPYLIFILFCVLGSILSRLSKRGQRMNS